MNIDERNFLTTPDLPHFDPPCLQIHKIDPSDYEALAKKVKNVWMQNIRFALTTEPNDTTRRRLMACEVVCEDLRDNLSTFRKDPAMQIYACYDTEKREQGFMVFQEKGENIEILDLATNPGNIAPQSIPDAHPVKGAGKALMQVVIQQNKAIKLSSHVEAITFYESLGFQAVPATGFSACTPMVLQKTFNKKV